VLSIHKIAIVFGRVELKFTLKLQIFVDSMLEKIGQCVFLEYLLKEIYEVFGMFYGYSSRDVDILQSFYGEFLRQLKMVVIIEQFKEAKDGFLFSRFFWPDLFDYELYACKQTVILKL